jgi:IclR family acetate operon transcriptional repressor
MPKGEITHILRAAHQNSPTNNSLPDIISETRQRRFAIDNEVNAVGLRCVAAPIFDEFSTPIAALSIAGGVRQIDIEALSAIGSAVRMAAAEVTQHIGGCTPVS